MAAAAASCEDGHGEEDVHNGDPGEHAGHASERASGRLRRGRPRTSAAAAVNLKPTAGDGAGANLLAAGAGAWPQAPAGAAPVTGGGGRRRRPAQAVTKGDELPPGTWTWPTPAAPRLGQALPTRVDLYACLKAANYNNTLKPNYECNRTE